MSTVRKPMKKSTMMLTISMMAIFIVFLFAILIVTVTYFIKKQDASKGIHLANGEAIYTEEELDDLITKHENQAEENLLSYIREELAAGSSTVSVLRKLYPNQIVLSSNSRYHFFDINENLKKHAYDEKSFMMDENKVLSYNDGTNVAKKGIDVSKYQGNIEWNKVAGDGIEYAIIRMGYRGYGESGKLVTDDTFETNMQGALANGIDVGVYFLTQAINEEEAIEEADYVLEAIKGYDVTYPVVLDVEEISYDKARTDGLSQEQWTKNCIAFCERIKSAGYTPMIYGNLKTFFIMLDLTQLEEYDKWFAYYDTPIYYPYDFTIWQYTEEGTVDGIKENVDLNISFYKTK